MSDSPRGHEHDVRVPYLCIRTGILFCSVDYRRKQIASRRAGYLYPEYAARMVTSRMGRSLSMGVHDGAPAKARFYARPVGCARVQPPSVARLAAEC